MTQLQAILSAYVPTASKIEEPLEITWVFNEHGGATVVVVVGGSVAPLGMNRTCAVKPSYVTLESVVQLTYIVLPVDS